MSQKTKKCVYCQRDDQQVPVVEFKFQGEKYYICSEHFPLLIHQPAKLVGKLPGAETWAGVSTLE
jgi:hypothetical protein